MQNVTTSFSDLVKTLKREAKDLKRIKIAILADFASQHLSKAIKAAGIGHRFDFQIWEGEYDSIESNIYNESSALYDQTFDYILIFRSTLKLYKQFSREASKDIFIERSLINTSALISQLQERTKSRILLTNYVEYNDGVFGNYSNKTSQSFLYQIRHFNFELMNLAIHQKNLFIIDIQSLIVNRGWENAFDPKLYVHADIIFDLDFMASIAVNTAQIISSIQGNLKKCVILDLDNTLWGGVIGDDGIENIQIGDLGLGKAFNNLQTWLRNLKNRGIILAVCSKNNEAVAKEAFLNHPGMTLRLEDISVFAANWETKVDNILFIQSILNIGFDSIVFLDDNPFERVIVKQHIPGITVPDLPEDPADYLPFLQSLNLFETASFTEDDENRTRQYQQEANRASLQKKFASEGEFLESLDMVATVRPFDKFTCPRVAQLSQRSNQFNLRTRRYTEEDISKMISDTQKIGLSISLKDSLGDYGLISAVILEKKANGTLFIDTWIMSCRVLKRGVEKFLLNELVEVAREQGFNTIEGEYIATAKNALVKDHYAQLGFTPALETNHWILDVKEYQQKQTFIKKLTSYADVR